jgi:hypothetical protein
MDEASVQTECAWERLDRAALGIIYGAIMVPSVLLAVRDHAEVPVETAVVLFGSILAVTLAKAFAELLSRALDTGERITRGAVRKAWDHSRPTLVTVNLATLLFILAAVGMIPAGTTVAGSQIVCIAFLLLLGARVGWVLDRRVVSSALGALFAGGVGLLLAVMKYLIH